MEGYHREGTSVSREDSEGKLRGDCEEIPGCVGYEGEGPTLAGGERERDDEDDGSCQPQRRGGRTGRCVGEHSVYIFSARIFFLGDSKRYLIRPDVDSPGWRTFVPVTTSNDQNMGKGRLSVPSPPIPAFAYARKVCTSQPRHGPALSTLSSAFPAQPSF